MARQAIHDHRVTVRLACQAFKISETCYRYDPKLSSENELIANWLLRLTTTHKQWGFGLCFMYLRNTKAFKWNHKRVYRIYKQLDLNLRIRHIFDSIENAQSLATEWMWVYNNERSHGSIGGISPRKLLRLFKQ